MWQLDGTIASWECEHLAAQLDLLAPHLGVHVQRWQGQSIDPEPVLQLSLRTPIHASSLDAYIRVGDLINHTVDRTHGRAIPYRSFV